jgi:hypothetical protein
VKRDDDLEDSAVGLAKYLVNSISLVQDSKIERYSNDLWKGRAMDSTQLQDLIHAILATSKTTWLAITQTIFSGFGVILIIIAFFQLKSFIKAHNELMQWNKSSMQNQILYANPSIELDTAVADVLKNIGVKPYEKISIEKCEKILNDPIMYVPIKHLLNHYETICVALSGNTVDQEIGYNLYSARIVVLWDQFELFCKMTREQLKDQEAFWEIERWAKIFSAEMKKREEYERKSREEAEKMIEQGRGMMATPKTVTSTRKNKSWWFLNTKPFTF